MAQLLINDTQDYFVIYEKTYAETSPPNDTISKQTFRSNIEEIERFVQVFKLENSSESKQSSRCVCKGLNVNCSWSNF